MKKKIIAIALLATITLSGFSIFTGCGTQPSDIESSSGDFYELEPVSSKTSETKTETITIGQKNALRSANSYLHASSFSYKGLIKQLEYEGYSTSEATYAADHCNADWKEQAVKTAKSYLKSSAFSRSKLIRQLEYEGFTHEQAVYGVEQNGY